MTASRDFTFIPHPVQAIQWQGDQGEYNAIASWCAETDNTLRDWPESETDLELAGRRLPLNFWVVRRDRDIWIYTDEHFRETFWNEQQRVAKLDAALTEALVRRTEPVA